VPSIAAQTDSAGHAAGINVHFAQAGFTISREAKRVNLN